MADQASQDALRRLDAALRAGARAMSLAAVDPLLPRLRDYYALLVRWLPRVRLVGSADPETVAQRHFLDSLTAVPFLEGLEPGRRLLDVGAGAGFPGLPLALTRPDLEVLLVDSDRRKVAFLNAAIAALGLPRAQARWARLAGDPAAERIPASETVISRAFQDLERWIPLGRRYLAPGGRLLAMLGARQPAEPELAALAAAEGLAPDGTWAGRLPDGELRAIVALRDTT